METRPGWDDYFMEIAAMVATRSTCLRRQVGCVIVKDRRILSTGYNGAPSGVSHCSETGCRREKEGIPSGQRHEMCRGVHAEQNAIIQGARYGIILQGATAYLTTQPCSICTKMLINAGIEEIIFDGDYPDEMSRLLLKEAGVFCHKYKKAQNTPGKGV
ncbi:tRNA-specific adenosine deaminase [bioreactor metagenome]|uniref:tRNA-specific adenosine deaminase n=1 Tax=bioreactor metagenome TaxID=1076179 RepID=A0A645HM97_9ZZZZ